MLFPKVVFLLSLAVNRKSLVVNRKALKSSINATEVAEALLESVCTRFKVDGLSGKSPVIEEMIDELANCCVMFDPSLCLNGPLYAVQYIDLGPEKTPPSWVKYTTKGSIVGQQYLLKNPASIKELRVLNYAELFEGLIQLKTSGSCSLDKDEPSNSRVQPFQLPFLNPGNGNKIRLLKCPADYIIPPDSSLSSTLSVLGKALFQFSIKGEGTARIIYADQNLRIFEAPPSKANWEPRGIRTVQVRVDLVKGNFVL